MPTYAIWDVQGCSQPLHLLLDHIRFNPQHDRLWFVGDLANRGPDSVGVLRLIKALGSAASVVLGNHDLFLLAAAEDIVSLRPKDTIQDVLNAHDRNELIEWLRHRPLCHREDSFVMVHAGLLPQWSVEEAALCAQEIEQTLTGSEYRGFLKEVFHGSPQRWETSLTGIARTTVATRVLTRIRTCTITGELSGFSGPLDGVPPGYFPWFRVAHRRNRDGTIITGHWAALGLHFEDNHWGIDSGCVWGRALSAVRLEDRTVFQVDGWRR